MYEVDFSRNEATGFSNPTGDTCVGPGMVSRREATNMRE